MQFAAKLKDLQLDMETNKVICTFEIENLAVNRLDLQKYKEYDLCSVEVSKWTDKRSLNANSYFHVLIGKIAEKLTISKAKAKNMMIGRYGQPMTEDGQIIVFKTNAPVEYMEELETLHTIPLKFGEDANFYKVFRGSSTYNTEEMSALIDGTVADAKELGIETLPPIEIERMKERWGM